MDNLERAGIRIDSGLDKLQAKGRHHTKVSVLIVDRVQNGSRKVVVGPASEAGHWVGGQVRWVDESPRVGNGRVAADQTRAVALGAAVLGHERFARIGRRGIERA